MTVSKDIIIIGAGAAGLTAAQYAARANLRTLVVEELAAGGQALIIDRLENYPGFPEPISGLDFARKMETQARNFGAEFINTTITGIIKQDNYFNVKTTGSNITSYTVVLATGAKHKTLNVPGEKEYTGSGVSYCATCDGPFFKDKKMLVVGGGDAACDESMFLANLTDKVIVVHRRNRFRAQKALAARVKKNPHIEVRFNTELKEILGDKQVNKVKLVQNIENRVYEEQVAAVFIFIGTEPQSGIVSAMGVTLDNGGYIKTNEHMETKISGLYAVGDVRATPFRQLVVAAGEGAIAAHMASQYIDELKGQAYK